MSVPTLASRGYVSRDGEMKMISDHIAALARVGDTARLKGFLEGVSVYDQALLQRILVLYPSLTSVLA